MALQRRWKALSVARFGGIDINSAENIISLNYSLHKAIDDDCRFAILPVRSRLRLCQMRRCLFLTAAWAADLGRRCSPANREPAVAIRRQRSTKNSINYYVTPPYTLGGDRRDIIGQ